MSIPIAIPIRVNVIPNIRNEIALKLILVCVSRIVIISVVVIIYLLYVYPVNLLQTAPALDTNAWCLVHIHIFNLGRSGGVRCPSVVMPNAFPHEIPPTRQWSALCIYISMPNATLTEPMPCSPKLLGIGDRDLGIGRRVGTWHWLSGTSRHWFTGSVARHSSARKKFSPSCVGVKKWGFILISPDIINTFFECTVKGWVPCVQDHRVEIFCFAIFYSLSFLVYGYFKTVFWYNFHVHFDPPVRDRAGVGVIMCSPAYTFWKYPARSDPKRIWF